MGIMLEEEKIGETPGYISLNLAINSVLRQKRENGRPFLFSQHRSEKDKRDHLTPEDQLAGGGEGVLIPDSARASFSFHSSFLHESLILSAASCLVTLFALNDTTSIKKQKNKKNTF